VAQAQNQPALAPDGTGGVYFAWVDARTGFNSDILAVRWDTTAATLPGWASGGSNVTLVTCSKSNPAAVGDGSGGALFAWEDNRCTGFSQIFARRVAAGGIGAAGWPANGVKLAATSTNQLAPVIVADGAGGAFVAWSDLRVADGDVYLQHVDGAGNIVAGWPAAGLAIASGSAAQSKPVAAPDGAGGVFVAWQQGAAGSVDVYLQHVNGAGAIAPGFVANGVPVSAAADDQQAPSIAADGAGGVVLAWEDRRSGGLDIYATRVNGNATLPAGFAANGNPVAVTAETEKNARVVSDGAGGLIDAWEHYNAGLSPDVYAARLTAAGALAPGWTANGTPLVTASGDQTNPVLAGDGAGGAYVTWQDRRAGNWDIYATRVASDGSTPAGWAAGGAPVCTVAGDQTGPQITAALDGAAFVIWTDARNSGATGLDLYAHRLRPNGVDLASPNIGLAATHHTGQTFLTWTPPPGTGWTHRIYFSASPIAVDADLDAATLLGSVGDSAATDRRLSNLTKTIYTFRTDSAAVPLAGEKGLFVVTVPANRQGWYAVTSQLAGSAEDRRVVPGANSLSAGVSESVAQPRPVFQRVLTQAVSADVYTLWTWNVDTPLFPAMSNRAGWPYDCSVTHGIPKGPTFVRAHALGGDFTGGFQASGNAQEWVVSLDDYTLNSDAQTWWYGYHPGYDFTSNSNPVPTTGTVIDYTNRRVLHTIRWARANFDLDTTRVYSFGFSIGGTWSMELAFAHPELIAAAAASTGKADYSFLSEPVVTAGYNPSGQYRPVVNRLWGTVATNLPSSEGLPIFVQMNDDSLAARTEQRGAVFTMNFSGRHDETVGWKEKLGYFESMRLHRQGHTEFWDNRDHGGFIFPAAMAPNLNLQYLYRFKSTLSWPAFSNCSADNVVGDGTASSGDSLGTINGYMEWDPAVTDANDSWAVTLSTRGLSSLWGPLPAPESLTVDVTPRRLQHFHPAVGAAVDWTARRSADNALVQSGTVNVDALGLVTIPQVKVYRTGTKLALGSSGVGVPPQVPRAGTIVLAPFANPVHGHAAFRITWPRDGAARIELFDTAGRRVRLLLDGMVTAGAWQADADLAGLASGVYTARAVQGAERVVRRLIVLQ
jgi:beta propeller repeat protein